MSLLQLPLSLLLITNPTASYAGAPTSADADLRLAKALVDAAAARDLKADDPKLAATCLPLLKERFQTQKPATLEAAQKAAMDMGTAGLKALQAELGASLKAKLDQSQSLRSELAEFRNAVRDWQGGEKLLEASGLMTQALASQMADRLESYLKTDGSKSSETEKAEVRHQIEELRAWPQSQITNLKIMKLFTKEGAIAHLEALESRLQSLADLAQKDQLELQAVAQKQQAVLQLLSNLIKVQNDTLKNILSNLK